MEFTHKIISYLSNTHTHTHTHTPSSSSSDYLTHTTTFNMCFTDTDTCNEKLSFAVTAAKPNEHPD